VSSPRQLRLAVLASGKGSNLQALIDACADPCFGARVAAVLSDREEAFALERARRASIPAFPVPTRRGESRADYDIRLAGLVTAHDPDYVLLLGWMRLLSMAFISRFPGRIVNLHPALPATFPGTHAIERAYEASREGRIAHTGVMLHFVPDEGVDSGPLIASVHVPIYEDDSFDDLEARVHGAEHGLLVRTIGELARQGE
jgi:phosphoribosylglycinamide formyltransferase-1